MSAELAPAPIALTEEQRQAVARRSGSLLISAGAGAGKTSVLVERLVSAVREDGLSPAQILMITFTDRAAAELRQRVRSRFIELGDRESARDLENAFVCTFHGFCTRVLYAHALQAGLDPDFVVLEQGLADRLRSVAFAGALRSYLIERGEPVVEVLGAYGADRVRAMIYAIYDELRSRGELEPRLPPARIETSVEAAASAFGATIVGARVELEGVLSAGCGGTRAHQGLEALERAGVLLARATLPSPRELAELKLRGAATGALAGAGCEAYRQALIEFTRACTDLRGVQVCGLLDGLLERFASSYAQLKRDRRALDFDDLELLARALLDEHPQIRASWSERFELLMVDEFQDSNPRQLQILAALERENLCVVGDEFQSIYGFRHADVSLFRAHRAALAQHDGTVTLAHNFRAQAGILEVINPLFAARFGDHYAWLIPARSEAPQETELVELLLCDKREPTPLEHSSDPAPYSDGEAASTAPWRLREAHMLASRIAQLLSSGDADPGDVVLLLRALGDVAVYERALAEQGIRTIAAVGGFWGHQQVGDLLSYLQTLANPLDELALLSTLACPIVGISSDGLALLTGLAREQKRTLWQTLRERGEQLHGFLEPAQQSSLARFCDFLEHERPSAPARPIAELIERIVDFSDYRTGVCKLSWGQRRLANIHKLMRLAHSFEASEGRDLRGFLNHVAQLELSAAGSEPDAPVADEQLSAIRLMSIHAAKGLEFPIVCIPELGRAPNLRAPDLLVDRRQEDQPRLGLKLLCLDGSEPVDALDFTRLREQRRVAEAQEEQRILYVAMTRARERLLLSAAVDFERWPEDSVSAPSIGWLAPALVDDLPGLLNAGEGTSVPTLAGTQARVRCTVSTAVHPSGPSGVEQVSGHTVAQRPVVDPLADLTAASAEQLSLPGMDHTSGLPELSREQLTVSYSALAKLERCGYRYYLEDVLGLPDSSPPRGELRAGLDGRSRGRIVHRLLEGVDFTRPYTPPPQAVMSAGRELGVNVTDEEAQRLTAAIGRLGDSALAKRLAGAREISREQPFAFALPPLTELARGVFDIRAREDDGGWLIVDYKSELVAPQQDLEALVRSRYGTQRLLYALAALNGGAPVVQVIHWFLERPGDPVTATYRAPESARLERELTDRAEELQGKGFTVSDNPHRELCLTCPGRRGLCSWDEHQTLRTLTNDRS
ncbi:MAG: UvrD-helicase domain-containing protein [Solirubrobacteraceae bacterium]